jgi:hypothetical protein
MKTNVKEYSLHIFYLFRMLDIFSINPSVVSKSLRSVNTIVQVLLLGGPKTAISCRSGLFIKISPFCSFSQGFLGLHRM